MIITFYRHGWPPLPGLRSLSRERLELPGLRDRRDKKQSQAPVKALQNARRLYRIVKPLAPTRYPSNDQDREKCVGPEFGVRSSQPILQLDLASGNDPRFTHSEVSSLSQSLFVVGCSIVTTIMVVFAHGTKTGIKSLSFTVCDNWWTSATIMSGKTTNQLTVVLTNNAHRYPAVVRVLIQLNISLPMSKWKESCIMNTHVQYWSVQQWLSSFYNYQIGSRRCCQVWTDDQPKWRVAVFISRFADDKIVTSSSQEQRWGL